MRKLLFVIACATAMQVSAQTPQTAYVVPSIAAMKIYFGNANRVFVVDQNADYSICSACTADETTVYAGAGGRKWKKVSVPFENLATHDLTQQANRNYNGNLKSLWFNNLSEYYVYSKNADSTKNAYSSVGPGYNEISASSKIDDTTYSAGVFVSSDDIPKQAYVELGSYRSGMFNNSRVTVYKDSVLFNQQGNTTMVQRSGRARDTTATLYDVRNAVGGGSGGGENFQATLDLGATLSKRNLVNAKGYRFSILDADTITLEATTSYIHLFPSDIRVSHPALINLDAPLIKANSLEGTGTRMVVANATGEMSTQAIPSGGSADSATFATVYGVDTAKSNLRDMDVQLGDELTTLATIKLSANSAITGATKTKITYDSKGLVTAGADLVIDDIPNLPASKITTGVIDTPRLPRMSFDSLMNVWKATVTGYDADVDQVLGHDATGAWEWKEPGASLTQLTAPGSFDAVSGSSSQISLSWTDVSNESGYEIDYSEDAGSTWLDLTSPAANATSYNHTGLDASTTYHYRMRSVGDGVTYSSSAWTYDNETTDAGGGGGSLEALAWPSTSSSWTESPTGHWAGAINSHGVADLTIPSGETGWVTISYNGTTSNGVAIGIDEDNTLQDYKTGGTSNWLTTGYVYDGAAYSSESGAIDQNRGGTFSTGQYLRIHRDGSTGTIKLQKGDFGMASWSDVHTFTATSTATLYIKASFLVASMKILDPKRQID